MKTRTIRSVKYSGTKVRLPEVIEWQGHELKLERHVNSQWANWRFRNERISLHLMRWLSFKEGDRDCYSLSITWELARRGFGTELSMVVRGSTMDEVLGNTTQDLNDLFETLPEDFPE